MAAEVQTLPWRIAHILNPKFQTFTGPIWSKYPFRNRVVGFLASDLNIGSLANPHRPIRDFCLSSHKFGLTLINAEIGNQDGHSESRQASGENDSQSVPPYGAFLLNMLLSMTSVRRYLITMLLFFGSLSIGSYLLRQGFDAVSQRSQWVADVFLYSGFAVIFTGVFFAAWIGFLWHVLSPVVSSVSVPVVSL
jgi:hypothetical protein